MGSKLFESLLQQLCQEEGIHLVSLSYGWVLQLTRKGKVRYIIGSHIDLNSDAAAAIACDKSACFQALSAQGVPVVEHQLLIDPAGANSMHTGESIWQKAGEYLIRHGGSVVVKPNDSKQGNGVYLCHSQVQLEWAVGLIFKKYPNLCLCPYYDVGYEYRVFFVDGKCLHAYAKEKPFVVGDGGKTIERLAQEQGIVMNDPGVDPQYIPHRGEKVILSWKHNLSRGARAIEVTDQSVIDKLYALAAQGAAAINIKYCTVDIIELSNGRQMILEINASIGMSKYVEQYPERIETAREIYRTALRAMFSPEQE